VGLHLQRRRAAEFQGVKKPQAHLGRLGVHRGDGRRKQGDLVDHSAVFATVAALLGVLEFVVVRAVHVKAVA